jgi:hypothetical protein
MPMLDEKEFAEISELWRESVKATQAFRLRWRKKLEETNIDEHFQPVRRRYEELTGMKDCHHDAIWHHRISLYGPPCTQCGKPLRTPQAKLCGSCMAPVVVAST